MSEEIASRLIPFPLFITLSNILSSSSHRQAYYKVYTVDEGSTVFSKMEYLDGEVVQFTIKNH